MGLAASTSKKGDFRSSQLLFEAIQTENEKVIKKMEKKPVSDDFPLIHILCLASQTTPSLFFTKLLIRLAKREVDVTKMNTRFYLVEKRVTMSNKTSRTVFDCIKEAKTGETNHEVKAQTGLQLLHLLIVERSKLRSLHDGDFTTLNEEEHWRKEIYHNMYWLDSLIQHWIGVYETPPSITHPLLEKEHGEAYALPPPETIDDHSRIALPEKKDDMVTTAVPVHVSPPQPTAPPASVYAQPVAQPMAQPGTYYPSVVGHLPQTYHTGGTYQYGPAVPVDASLATTPPMYPSDYDYKRMETGYLPSAHTHTPAPAYPPPAYGVVAPVGVPVEVQAEAVPYAQPATHYSGHYPQGQSASYPPTAYPPSSQPMAVPPPPPPVVPEIDTSAPVDFPPPVHKPTQSTPPPPEFGDAYPKAPWIK